MCQRVKINKTVVSQYVVIESGRHHRNGCRLFRNGCRMLWNGCRMLRNECRLIRNGCHVDFIFSSDFCT